MIHYKRLFMTNIIDRNKNGSVLGVAIVGIYNHSCKQEYAPVWGCA